LLVEPIAKFSRLRNWESFMSDFQILLLDKDGTLKQIVPAVAANEAEARMKAEFLAQEYGADEVEVRAQPPSSKYRVYPEPWKAWE
jgi:hypothetical protein